MKRHDHPRPLNSDSLQARAAKIERLESGAAPRVLDLFAGCGGLSLGFQRAGFEIAGGVEIDKHAARTHAENFHSDLHGTPAFEAHAAVRDITITDPEDLARDLELGPVDRAVDVLVGGPPCQSYARVGRAKLREIAEHPEAFLNDDRGNLYLRYLEYVRQFAPLAVVIENVPDALNYGGHNIAEEICEVLDDMGYRTRYTLLNSSFYGVPQMRERMFIVAYALEANAQVAFPTPSHWVDLPRGYEGTRQVALKAVTSGLFDAPTSFIPWPEPDLTLTPAVTAEEALDDLPRITLHLEGKLKKGARRFDTLLEYDRKPETSYGRSMREWPGFESRDGIYDHAIRYLPRDYAIFARMSPGDQYPEAHELAKRMFEEKLDAHTNGSRPREGTPEYESLWSATVPGYDPHKFPNKWRKMEPDAPARTLMAHLGKDSYSHIHYDSEQARTISVREAARLQSFPDGFHFSGTMNPAFKQIGNAVPPLMAFALAGKVRAALTQEEAQDVAPSALAA